METQDLILIGGLGLAVYLIFGSGLKKAGEGVGDVVGSAGALGSDVLDFIRSGFDAFKTGIESIGKNNGAPIIITVPAQPPGYDAAGQTKNALFERYMNSPSSPPAFSSPAGYSHYLSTPAGQSFNQKPIPARNAQEFLNQKINAIVPGYTRVQAQQPPQNVNRYYNFRTGGFS